MSEEKIALYKGWGNDPQMMGVTDYLCSLGYHAFARFYKKNDGWCQGSYRIKCKYCKSVQEYFNEDECGEQENE